MADEKEKPIPVIFRADRSGEFKGDVTAVFPTMPYDIQGTMMECYAHVGQHGGCSWAWYHTTRPAKPDAYKPLLTELEQTGYKLRVVKRISPSMRAEFRRALTGRD